MLDRHQAPSYREIETVEIARAEKTTLDNGIPLHIIKSGTEEVVRLEFIFDAGHWYEPQNGVSYFTTKLLTSGTKQRTSREIEEQFALYGAFVDIITGYDRSTFVLYALSKHLKSLLPLLTEILREPTFPEEELENLKNISLQNYRVNLKKTGFIASKHFRETIFGPAHPYSRTIDEGAIKNTSRESLVKYHTDRFSSSDLNIIISGNGNEDFFKIINEAFGKGTWGNQKFTETKYTVTSAQQKHILIEKGENLQSSIRMGMNLFPIVHPDYFKVNFLTEALGGYFGSRLMKNIREDKGYTYGISAGFHSLKHAGYLMIGTDVNKENTQNAINEIIKEIRILKREPIPADELTTLRNYLLGSFVSSLSTPFGVADRFKTIYFHNLGYDFYDQYIHSLRNITPEDLIHTANKYFSEDLLIEVVAGGK